MSTPAYADLGKQARDVFGKGYHVGLLKLDIKTKTESGIEFGNEANYNPDSGKVFGTIETKNKVKEYGLTLSEKINTDNIFSLNATLQDQIIKGLKLSVDSSYAPQTGSKTSKLKASFINNVCALNCDTDIDHARPLINASAVFKYDSWLTGYQFHFDTFKCNVVRNNLAVGYSGSDFTLHASVDNGQIFDTSIFQKVTPRLDYGITFNWSAGSPITRFAIGCKYALDEDASVRAKINNACLVGVGYQQKLRDGITLTLSALIDARNFNGGSHKLGMGFEIEA